MVVPSVISVMMCVLDVVFNYIFIFIFNMEVAGAALGTLLAIVIAASSETWLPSFALQYSLQSTVRNVLFGVGCILNKP